MSKVDKPKAAIVERHHYVLDWFDITKEELDLEHTVYEFNYRFGPDWYLQATRYDQATEKWEPVVWPRGDSFRIQDAGGALAALGNRVTSFTAIQSNMKFVEALQKLFARAEYVKSREPRP